MNSAAVWSYEFTLYHTRPTSKMYSGTSLLGHLSGWVISLLRSLLPSPVGDPNTEVPLYIRTSLVLDF